MSPPPLTVVVCTHAPRPDFLRRTLEALQAQDLPREEWELLIIDNASPTPVEKLITEWGLDLELRVLLEPELGLVAARRAGIRAGAADVLVFVDDDNVLASDYLSVVRRIAEHRTDLGVWGGQQHPDFETPPAEDIRPFVEMLGLRTLQRDTWTFTPFAWEAAPFGAGMCVRKPAALRWLEELARDPGRQALGVRGDVLMRGEDFDLVFTTVSTGLGCGLFKDLSLHHLMPTQRLTKAYLLRLAWHNGYSAVFLQRIHGIARPRAYGRAELTRLLQLLTTGNRTQAQLTWSDWRGRQKALRQLAA